MSDSPTPMSVFEDALKDEYGTRRTFSSFRNSTLTAENTASFLTCCNYLPLIHPYGPFRHFIDFIITIALIYTCIEVPVSLAFKSDLHNTPLDVIDMCIDILLLFDVIINFRTAYFDKFDRLTLVRDPYEVAKRYFASWFFIDLIASLPLHLFPIHNYIIFGLLRCLKILRLIKIVRIYNKFKKTIVSRNVKSFLKLSQLLLSMLLFAHFSACFWYFIGYHNTGENGTDETWIDKQGLRDSNLSTFKLYSFAWYWAVVTLFTTGYGDITATNTLEQWVSSILILIGTCFFSYFIGTLTVLITEGDKEGSYTLERLEEAQNFCSHKKLPTELARAILTHTRYYCENNYVFDEEAAVDILPLHLQLQIEYYLSSHFIKQIRIFKSLNDSILGQIALKIRSISCNATHRLYHKGQRAKEIYIQRTGLSEIDYHDTRKKSRTLTRGEVFGEDAFTSPKRRTTVTCKTWCEFYAIPIVEVINILQNEYPKTYINKLRIIIDAVRSKTQQQPKIDFRKYRHAHDAHSDTDDVEIDPLENFLNQPANDLGIRLQSIDSNKSQKEQIAKKKKSPDIKKKQSQLQLWSSKFQLFRNSSTFRDRVARRQLTKRTLFKAREELKKDELSPKQKKMDKEHIDFYAQGGNNTETDFSTDEDIEDIVPGLAAEALSASVSNATLSNADSLTIPTIPLQFSAKLKKPKYGGTTSATRFGMKGMRRNSRKMVKNKNIRMGRQKSESVLEIAVKEGDHGDVLKDHVHNKHDDKILDTVYDEEDIEETEQKKEEMENNVTDNKLDKVQEVENEQDDDPPDVNSFSISLSSRQESEGEENATTVETPL